MTKEKLVKKIAELLNTDRDLDFLLRLEKEKVEALAEVLGSGCDSYLYTFIALWVIQTVVGTIPVIGWVISFILGIVRFVYAILFIICILG